MRSTAWPNGAYRPRGDFAPHEGPTPLETISGVLQVRSGVFGHKWVYKLNETRKRKKYFNGVKFVDKMVILAGLVVVVVMVVALVVVFGPKYINKIIPSNTTSNNWQYQLSSKIQNKIKLIFSISTSSFKQKNKQNITVQQINDRLQIKHNISAPGCESCLKTEICLQNSSAAYPECVSVKDPRDPTGCGGLCKLEVQFCKKLNSTLNIFGCIDIETLKCSENEWKCSKTLMCISRNRTCDGLIHCPDKSDEFFCECDLRKNFRCTGNISCIPNSKRCNGAVDCWDASDELKCTGDCGLLNIPCYNGQCIPKEKWCDGVFDCSDKSDEPYGCVNANLNDKGR